MSCISISTIDSCTENWFQYETSLTARDGRERLIAWHNPHQFTMIDGAIITSLSSGEKILQNSKARRRDLRVFSGRYDN